MSQYLHTHRGESVRLYELLRGGVDREGAMLDGHDFEDCEIGGPAVIFLMHDVDLVGVTFDERADMFLLAIDPLEHPHGIVGVIGIRNCRFHRCRFTLVSVVGTRPDIDRFKASLNAT